MQFDLLRAFPYPVLRPRVNDYVEGDIQATVHLEPLVESGALKASVQFAVSVPEIVRLVEAGDAAYVVVFACRDTYFRRSISSSQAEFEHAFDAGALRGEVVIYPYVVALRRITNFMCAWINAEFGPGPFVFEEGAVLALDPPSAVFVDREAFKPISSLFVLVASESLTDQEWRVDASDDKVKIEVSPALKAKLDAARNNTRHRAILLNSIYFGAVCQCLSYLRHQGDEFQERRWAGVFRQRCTDMNLSLSQHDEAVLAQKLMKFPFALLEAYCFTEDADR